MGSIESQWTVDDEESPDNKGKDTKKKDDKAANNRWVQPPLPRSEGILNSLNQRKDFTPPRPPLEQFLAPDKKSEEDDDEEDEEEPKEDKQAEVPEAAETSTEAQDEVFETITGGEIPAKPQQAEVMDIPHVDEDKPQVPLTAEENRTFTEMAAEFGPPAEAVEHKDIPRVDEDKPRTPLTANENRTFSEMVAGLDMPAPAPSNSEPFWRSLATHAPTESSPFAFGGSEAPASVYSGGGESSGGSSSGLSAAIEALKAATNLAELANNPNRLVTRVLTQVAVEGFLKRKQEQHGNEAMLRRQREEIARLHDEQRRTNEQLAGHLQHDTLSPDEQLEIFDQEGNRIILQPGWRVERSAGGYSVVVDRHGRVVHEAIRYGEAFQREQQREQLSDDIFAALKAGGAVGTHADGDGAAQQAVQANGQLQGIPAGGQHMLPASTDHDGQSAKKRKRLDDALMNPWLWFAVAVLIIVYFLAALA